MALDKPSGKKTLDQVMDEFQTLTSFGFGIFGGFFSTTPPLNGDISKNANEFLRLRNDLSLIGDEVLVSYEFIKDKPKRKTLNTRHSSYGMKHMVEKWTESLPTGHKYISNGAFIAAAVIAGFEIKQCRHDSPNCYLNISERAFS